YESPGRRRRVRELVGEPVLPGIRGSVLLRALINQLFICQIRYVEIGDTCPIVIPASAANSFFSSSVGYGWSTCLLSHCLSFSFDSLGRLPRRLPGATGLTPCPCGGG